LQLKDAIEYDEGSIIALDKLTSDAVDIFVDGILIAKGKVVAIEDTYGVKIVEIIENKELEKENND
jgi:flagellar motor switch protein FliN/FliY